MTSPHHLSATMVDGPRASDDGALRPARAGRRPRGGARRAARGARRDGRRSIPRRIRRRRDFRIDAVQLRDQIISPARTVLLVLLAASALVFVIACSNVANLILARSVRREGELAIRAALGASAGALRRTLLAESLLLCGAGAVLGVLIARPMVGDAGALRVALLGARARRDGRSTACCGSASAWRWSPPSLLAFVPRLPSADAAERARPVERQRAASRRARTGGCALFAVTQIAASFVLLAGAGMLITTLFALQAAPDRLQHAQRAGGERAGRVVRRGRRSRSPPFYKEVMRRISRAAGRRAGGRRHDRAVARGRRLRSGLPVHGRGLREGRRRGGSARAVPHGVARLLRGARRADHRRPRLQRRRSPRRRAGRHRQPEPGAADVPGAGRA